MSNTILAVGDIIRIKNKRGLKLVIRSEERVSHQAQSSCIASVQEFAVVDLKSPGSSGMLINPKESSFYFNIGSMKGTGVEMRVEDVKIIHKCKI